MSAFVRSALEQPTRKVIWSFAVAAAITLIRGLITSEFSYIAWHIGTLALAACSYVLGSVVASSPRLQPTVSRTLLLCACLVPIATIYTMATSLARSDFAYRPTLGLGNPNILAAWLAVLGVFCLLLSGRSPIRVLVYAAFGISLLATGSRTALYAFSVGTLCYIAQTHSIRRLLLAALLLLTLFGAIMLDPKDTVTAAAYEHSNLLRFSNELRASYWKTHYASEAHISKVRRHNAQTKDNVFRIVARSNDGGKYPGLVLFQNSEVSASGVSYVASLYIRADHPQGVRLSSNLASSHCQVTTEWSRCVTPAAWGNGHNFAGLYLHTLTPGASLDIDVWGAQLERGSEPTAAIPTAPNAFRGYILSELLNRFQFGNQSTYESIRTREATYEIALLAIQGAPFLGVGYGSFRSGTIDVDANSSNESPHAHNFVLHLWAELGVLGLVASLIPLVTVTLTSLLPTRSMALPLLASIAVLNTTDFTYFTFGSLTALWLGLGYIEGLRHRSREALLNGASFDSCSIESRGD